MNKQEIEDAAQKAKGKVKEAFGKVRHNPTTVAKGKAEQTAGARKEEVGKVRDRVKNGDYRDSQAI
jgi:uncharacterized protein YjbJ (UPF0337 family)